MSDNNDLKNGAAFTGVGAAIGTIGAAIAGTALAAPAAIGGGVCLLVYGIVKLVKDNKK